MLALVAMAAVVMAAFVLVALNGECGGTASCPATAVVDGRTYMTAIPRSLSLDPGGLVRYAAVTRRTGGQATLDEDAYRLGDVDPTKVLVMKLAPGQRDGAGELGEYLLLLSDASGWPLTCPYFSPGDSVRPIVCE